MEAPHLLLIYKTLEGDSDSVMHQGDIPEQRKYFHHAELTSSTSFPLCLLVKKKTTHPYVKNLQKLQKLTQLSLQMASIQLVMHKDSFQSLPNNI